MPKTPEEIETMTSEQHITEAAGLFVSAKNARGRNDSGAVAWMAEATFHATMAAAKAGRR